MFSNGMGLRFGFYLNTSTLRQAQGKRLRCLDIEGDYLETLTDGIEGGSMLAWVLVS